MGKDVFDYEVTKPDQSEIEVKKGYRDVVGKLVWNIRENRYEYLGLKAVSQKELYEIMGSMKKLNKKSILPKWLQWSRN